MTQKSEGETASCRYSPSLAGYPPKPTFVLWNERKSLTEGKTDQEEGGARTLMVAKSCAKKKEGPFEGRAPIAERILQWLLVHPYQRLDDLALATGRHPSSICRQLDTLCRQGLIESVKPTLGLTRSRLCYYLTAQGISAAATSLKVAPDLAARKFHADEKSLLRSLPRLHVLTMTQDLINNLVSHAPHALAYPGDVQTRIRWHWVREYQQRFVAKGKSMHCSIDAVLLLARFPIAETSDSEPSKPESAMGQEDYYSAFILSDPGLVGNDDLLLIRERLEHLLRWRESPSWWPHYSHFPPVLVLTPSERSRDLWQWSAREAASHLRITPLKGAVLAWVDEFNPPSAWQLPWHHLSSSGPCRLQTLWSPAPRKAVPPGLLFSRPDSPMANRPTDQLSPIAIVRGHFTQRATQPPPPLSEHPAAERLTASLLGLQANPRHLEIAQQLYAHPLLSREELAILLHLDEASLSRYLYDLKQMACVEEHVNSSCGRRFLLSQRGLRLMAMLLNVSLRHICTPTSNQGQQSAQRGVEYALKTIKHTTGIYRFITHLHLAASTSCHELAWWETGARCARHYHFQGRWHNLLPDAAFEYRAGEQIVHAWLEWDEGTMKRRDLEAKLHSYAQFIHARQWMKEGPVLPLLVIVVPEKGQELRMQQVVREILGETTLVVRSTTATRLEERGPLEE